MVVAAGDQEGDRGRQHEDGEDPRDDCLATGDPTSLSFHDHVVLTDRPVRGVDRGRDYDFHRRYSGPSKGADWGRT
jgi:hypothetical protein